MTIKSKREIERLVGELSQAEGSAGALDRPIFAYRNSEGDLVDEHGREIATQPVFGIK